MNKIILKKMACGAVASLICAASMPNFSANVSTVLNASAVDTSSYFYSDFEQGSGDWSARGMGTSVSVDTDNYYFGKKSLFVSGRTDNWNGVQTELDTSIFIPGNTYSFSCAVLQNSNSATDMKMTLQYTLSGQDNYDEVAIATAKSGEWTKLENTSFTIPDNAVNLILYVEAPDSLTDFYIDAASGAVEGTASNVVTGGGTVAGKTSDVTNPSVNNIIGDVNGDGVIDVFNVTNAKSLILKQFVGVTVPVAADTNQDGKFDVSDLVLIHQFVIGKINTFPKPPVVTTTTVTQQTTITTTTTTKVNGDSSSYMDKIKDTVTINVPSSATAAASNQGTMKSITYYSEYAQRNKKAKVLLPPGYSESEKYPVMYVNHGIFGDENSMISGFNIENMAANLAASGEAEKMIIVFTSMYTSKTSDQPAGMSFNTETTQNYDNFLYDITDSLMPYIEKNFSVKTGRENTAITGFSMGGREALYIGIMRPDIFGYIGAACPAPGITPAQDMFMTHPGNMQESEFKIKDPAYNPYVLMIAGGTNDSVVGTFPEAYHKTLTANNQEHIWISIPGGGHDASCVTPLMYNFIKSAFKS